MISYPLMISYTKPQKIRYIKAGPKVDPLAMKKGQEVSLGSVRKSHLTK